MNQGKEIANDLKERGITDREVGADLLTILNKKRLVYLGIDPTADSLHLGNLVPLIFLRHLKDAGHQIFVLIGGGTSLIGDPRESGERALIDQKTISLNIKSIQKQISHILGKYDVTILNNASWLKKLGALNFLRDIGKYFTINNLIKRDIVKKRLEAEDSISFTEFSYSLLQAYDFLYLNEKYQVDLQIGGIDQWPNIISGIDLIRRKSKREAYAITTPIIVDSNTGKKFGKSEGNAIWLDCKKTSPFSFYQFWLNVSDEVVHYYLKVFTFISLGEIEQIIQNHNQYPNLRVAQKRLAYAVTDLVHGSEKAKSVERVSEILYGDSNMKSLSEKEKLMILDEVPSLIVDSQVNITEALVLTGIAKSKSEARRLIQIDGLLINKLLTKDPALFLSYKNFRDDLIILHRGKKIAVIKLKNNKDL